MRMMKDMDWKPPKLLVREAIENFPNRDKSKIHIPTEQQDMVVGFSHETINYMLGGMFRASYRPLNDNIINGRIRGLGGYSRMRKRKDQAGLPTC